jgi:hypothetical protein
VPNPQGRSSLKFLLAAVPLALLGLAFYLPSVRGPYSLSQNFDPEYGYLLSSVSILNLHIPAFTDNPGTTVEEIGAAVGLVKWAAGRVTGGDESISRAILTHPEEYLRAIHFGLAALVAATVWWAGWTMSSLSGSLAAGLVLQLSVFFFTETTIAVARVSPEPLLLATAFAMAAILLPLILQAMKGASLLPAEEILLAGWAGALWGFGVITKFTFVPVGAVVLVFAARTARIRFLTAGVIAGLLFTLPIWRILYKPAFWLLGMLTHTGYYGEGERGIPGASQMLSNAWALEQMEPGFYALALFYAIVFVFGLARLRSNGGGMAFPARRLLWAGLLSIALQFAATVKQYRAHYMIPAFALMALINGCAVVLLGSRFWTSRQKAFLSLAAAILMAVSLTRGARRAHEWSQLGVVQKQDAAELAKLASTMSDCAVVGYYRSSAPGFGLAWGSEYAAGANAPAINGILPNTIVYNRFQHRFLSAAPELRTNEVQRMVAEGRCVLMQGTTLAEEPLVLPPGFSMNPVAERKNEGLYRLGWNPAER